VNPLNTRQVELAALVVVEFVCDGGLDVVVVVLKELLGRGRRAIACISGR